jgi:histidinol-phosphate phosphatase family protein
MKKLIFIDRDGVINKYPGDYKYVDSEETFVFLDGAKEAIALLTVAGYSIFVISNQAGVTKGLYSEKTLNNITKKMLDEVESYKGRIEQVLYCTHTEEEGCGCRKPKIGLIKKALNEIDLTNLNNSFFIGDSIRDVKTGKNAGCKTILVLSGREKIENKHNWQEQPDFIADNLYKAVEIILSQERQE